MSANGNAFHVYIGDSSAYLDGLDALEYYSESLPSDADMRLYDMVARFRAAGVAERRAFIDALSSSQRSRLALFAHRAATIAVRLNSKEWLEQAMLASVVANYDSPESRNIDLQLAILHYCAQKLGLTPVELFDWAATYAADPLAAHLEAFGRREDVSLKKFGWVERRTRDGVQFSARWQ